MQSVFLSLQLLHTLLTIAWVGRGVCDLETALPKCGPRNPPAEERVGYLGLAKVPWEENKPGRKGDCRSSAFERQDE